MLKRRNIISILIILCLALPVNKILKSLDKLTSNDYYLLEIPKINLKETFYPKDLHKNNLNYGIQTIKSKNNNSYLLASHSGNGPHSYFKNLEQLELNDEFFIHYQGLTKRYIIKEENYTKKDGLLKVYEEKKSVILLTCSKKYPDYQVYYVGIKA